MLSSGLGESVSLNLSQGFFNGKVVVADNSVLAPFVDSGYDWLLYQIAGQVLVAPSVIDPNPAMKAEFNRYIGKAPKKIAQRRRDYLGKSGQLWVQAQLSPTELVYVEKYREKYKEHLKGKDGDLETLAIAKVRQGIILTNDKGLIFAAKKEDVQRFYPCQLLVLAVQWSLIPCCDAEHLYNDIFVGKLKLFSKKRLCCKYQVPTCV